MASSFSSYFLLCLSMFLAVSNLGKAMPYDDDDDYILNVPYDDMPHYDNPPPPPPAESGEGVDYGYVYVNDYLQPPAPEWESGGGDDYGYANDEDDDNFPSSDTEYCPDVVERISTCQEYLNGHDDSPSPACCDNLEVLSGIGAEVGFRNLCDCMNELQASFDQGRAEDMLNKCGFALSFLPVSRRRCSES